jgi:hypothetical protein
MAQAGRLTCPLTLALGRGVPCRPQQYMMVHFLMSTWHTKDLVAFIDLDEYLVVPKFRDLEQARVMWGLTRNVLVQAVLVRPIGPQELALLTRRPGTATRRPAAHGGRNRWLRPAQPPTCFPLPGGRLCRSSPIHVPKVPAAPRALRALAGRAVLSGPRGAAADTRGRGGALSGAS